jgi:hypothetical protein
LASRRVDKVLEVVVGVEVDLILSDPGVEKLTEVLGCAYLDNFEK